jgi:hypothetical protein
MRNGFVFFVMIAMLVGGLAIYSQAADLLPPLVLENGQVLPKKVGNPRYIQFFFSADQRLGSWGGSEPLGSKLAKEITWQQIIDAQGADALKVQQVQALMVGEGYQADDVAGYSSGAVTTYVNTKVPTLAFGITERWTLAAVVPILKIEVNADTGFQDTSKGDAQHVIASACVSNTPECNKAASKLNNPVNEKLARLGYETIPDSQTVSGLGDIQLVSKYSLHKTDFHAVALKNTLILPTGRGPNVDRALDITTGDGRYQFSVGLVGEQRLPFSYDTKVIGFASSNFLLPTRTERRLPAAANDSLSADKESLRKNWGLGLTAGYGVMQEIPSVGLQFGAQYQVAYASAVTYSEGSRYAAERYEWLNDLQPSQTLHSAALLAGFSTVKWYQDKQFVYPFQANLVYSMPIWGRNVPLAQLVAAELVLFF